MQSGHMKGHHFCGLYYGDSHLITKALPFVMAGVTENAQILTILEPRVEQLLITALQANHIEPHPNRMGALPLHDLTEQQRKHGLRGLRQRLLKCVEQARTEGFHRLRIILCITHELALAGRTLPEFLQWEKLFHEASAGLPVTTLCLYDTALSVSEDELLSIHDRWSLDDQTLPPRDSAK